MGIVEQYKQFKQLKIAAEQGDADAQNDLGIHYGFSNSEGMKWFRKATEQGHADAQNNLGAYYIDSQRFVKNYIEAVKWFSKAAVQGHAMAQHNLGMCYEDGQGVPRDYSKAVEWYRKSAEQRQVKAQYKLACAIITDEELLRIMKKLWNGIARLQSKVMQMHRKI